MNKKRFIAGAQCPKCQQLDKIFTYEKDGETYRACTRCGFDEPMSFPKESPDMFTRVNRSRQERAEEFKPVRLMGVDDKD